MRLSHTMCQAPDLADASETLEHRCPSCGSAGMSVFYEATGVPVHSVLLLSTRAEALNYPKGDVALGFCGDCGFISNLAFDPEAHDYSSRYEETQGFSSTFNVFHRQLAHYLIDRYDLRGKDIVEIGCGKGEFLNLLCEMGDNRGVGFDPAYVSERNRGAAGARIACIKDFYSEKYAHYRGDFICCKMTLEHVQRTADFVGMVRRSVARQSNTVVFFQVPDVARVLREWAFWDIYYEHCSYFSLGSLARLFRRCGFRILDIRRDYDGQYLMIEAQPEEGPSFSPRPHQEDDLEALARDVASFSDGCRHWLTVWRRRLQQFRQDGCRTVLWGGGSKGVAFLTALDAGDEVAYVVDVNPYRQGTYMAGTGQEIVSPEFLREYRPDIVIVMNPIYWEEIHQDLLRMGLTPDMIAV